jgi:hypothetical protein
VPYLGYENSVVAMASPPYQIMTPPPLGNHALPENPGSGHVEITDLISLSCVHSIIGRLSVD